MRQCLGCNEHLPKHELIRVVRTPEGDVVADLTGKKNGRGAYLCPKAACLRKAQKSKRLDRALECNIPEDVYDSIELSLSEKEQA